MAYSPLAISSETALSNPSVLPALQNVDQPASARQSDVLDVITALQQTLAAGTQPPASVIHAATEFARILTGASGVALGVRLRGALLCRARSGELAPELGAVLNADSGISGECLRSATILVCQDAETDDRVDTEACRALGIRSIVAVPLRGHAGIMGILEAFSTRPEAFADEQINALRGLAGVIETASECERRARSTSLVRSRRPLFPERTVPEESLSSQILGEPSRKRRYWILGIAAIALLLISGAVWLSWHDPTPGLAGGEAAQSAKTEPTSNQAPPRATFPKPDPGIVRHRTTEPLRPSELVKKAAEIQTETSSQPDVGNFDSSGAITRPASAGSAEEGPPSVEVVANIPNSLPAIAARPGVMPTLHARVSDGVTQANLIHEVQPTYPAQARMRHLAGSVTLDATIGENGTVREVRLVSGPPLLAAAATDAVRQWRYNPAVLDGKAVEVQKRITIVFKLP
jgi:periplasmic protein TonB